MDNEPPNFKAQRYSPCPQIASSKLNEGRSDGSPALNDANQDDDDRYNEENMNKSS
jgi:hypothetical protein